MKRENWVKLSEPKIRNGPKGPASPNRSFKQSPFSLSLSSYSLITVFECREKYLIKNRFGTVIQIELPVWYPVNKAFCMWFHADISSYPFDSVWMFLMWSYVDIYLKSMVRFFQDSIYFPEEDIKVIYRLTYLDG